MLAVDNMDVVQVDSSAQLNALVAQWQQLPALAMDTEFMRTNTFYPKLGLLQIGDGKNCYLIDPLQIDDWQAFIELMQDDSVEFVVHSAGEDLNLLFTSFGQLPARLFDTQLAAAFQGLGFSLSYQGMIQTMLGIELEKGETRSDWLKRPLSDSQLCYAALDVRYLLAVRDQLAEQLRVENKLAWFEEDCQQLLDIARDFESESCWTQLYASISNAWRLDEQGLLFLQRLCYWRELTARKKNRPRNWIAKDAELYQIADAANRWSAPDLDRLLALKDVQPGLLKHRGKQLLQVMFEDSTSVPGAAPQRLSPPLTPFERKLIKRLQQSARDSAEELQLAPELLARKRQLLQMLDTSGDKPKIVWQGDMAGWRKDQLEESFEAIVNGS